MSDNTMVSGDQIDAVKKIIAENDAKTPQTEKKFDPTVFEAPVIEHGYVQEVEEAKGEEDRASAIVKEYEDLIGRIVPPHRKVAREMTDEDANKVQDDLQVLYRLCFTPHGLYRGAYAMAHPQIDDKDPLRLFVMSNMLIVCNPRITRHSNYTVDSEEACMSFSVKPMTTVQRWQKIDVEYRTIIVDPEDEKKFKLSELKTEKVSGPPAKVFAHEIDHLDGKYI